MLSAGLEIELFAQLLHGALALLELHLVLLHLTLQLHVLADQLLIARLHLSAHFVQRLHGLQAVEQRVTLLLVVQQRGQLLQTQRAQFVELFGHGAHAVHAVRLRVGLGYCVKARRSTDVRWILLEKLHQFGNEFAEIVVQCPCLQLGMTLGLDGTICFVNRAMRQLRGIGALISGE